MKTIAPTLLLLASLPALLLAPSTATAVNGELSYATTNGGPVFDCPAGDVPLFPAGTLTVVLLDDFGQPEPGIPASEIYLEGDPDATPDPHLAGCGIAGPIHADGPTDANGVTTYSGPFNTGGYGTLKLAVRYQGELTVVTIVQTGIEIESHSADLNGDLVVNLADLGDFAAGYGDPANVAVDLDGSGQHDLADVYLFSIHFGHSCP